MSTTAHSATQTVPSPQTAQNNPSATFRFTDNRPAMHRKVEVMLTAEQFAEHLMKDRQFEFYACKGYGIRDSAVRSAYLYPPNEKAVCMTLPTEQQWQELESAVAILVNARMNSTN